MATCNVGDVIKNDKKDIVITRKEKIKKGNKTYYYQFKCNKCGYDCSENYVGGKYRKETWVTIDQIKKSRCGCCARSMTVPGINSIYATSPDLVKYFENVEDSKKYTLKSDARVTFVCPECGAKKDMVINNFTQYGFPCPKCSDKIPIGEKVMYSVLQDLGIDFMYQLTCATFTWCGKYRYDFYIPEHKIIVETHGLQHYENAKSNTIFWSNKTVKEEIQNDKDKFELATKNGIKNYFVINTSETDFDFIKESIISSELNRFYDLSNIDWDKIREISAKSIIKDICQTWMENPTITLDGLHKIYKFAVSTLRRYLKTGFEIGWCDYNGTTRRTSHYNTPKENAAIRHAKPIVCLNNNTYFKSIGICSKHSEEIFGRYIGESTIRFRADNNNPKNKIIKYNFKYVTKQEFNDAIKNGCVCYGSPFSAA